MGVRGKKKQSGGLGKCSELRQGAGVGTGAGTW